MSISNAGVRVDGVRVEMKPVRRKQLLHKSAQTEIKQYILSNGLTPGDPLPPESALADQLGISRTVVREAVKGLEALGLIEVRAGAGLFVNSFSFDRLIDHSIFGIQFHAKQLADVLEVRHHIEWGMSEKAVQARTPEQVANLRGILSGMRSRAERGEYDHELDERFHRELYVNIDNAFVHRILEIFWEIYQDANTRGGLPKPRNPLATHQRHEDIVEALALGDVEAMHAAMERHRVGVEERLRLLEESQSLAAVAP